MKGGQILNVQKRRPVQPDDKAGPVRRIGNDPAGGWGNFGNPFRLVSEQNFWT